MMMFGCAQMGRIAIASFVIAFAAGCYSSQTSDDDVGDPVEGADDGRDGTVIDADGDDATPPPGIPFVDILVLVDYSGSMAQEEVALIMRLPELFDELINPTDADGDGRLDHPAVTDIHVGVISADLGIGGFAVPTCLDDPWDGDNGCLLHEAAPDTEGCAPSYPLFLSYDAADPTSSLEGLTRDYRCIGFISDYPGVAACGWEQPLAAIRRATTENAGPGACNEGFLRPDSLLVLIILSDEDDCSVLPDHPEMFDPARTDLGHLNIRCHVYPEFVEPVENFVAATHALRADRPDRLVVGMIVGVPPDAPECTGSGEEIPACLSVPAMQEQLDPAMLTQLIPSCNSAMGIAMPPVRLVRMAQQLGDTATVGSICLTDYRDTIRAITQKVVERLGP
jgi:hypothetical protein